MWILVVTVLHGATVLDVEINNFPTKSQCELAAGTWRETHYGFDYLTIKCQQTAAAGREAFKG